MNEEVEREEENLQANSPETETQIEHNDASPQNSENPPSKRTDAEYNWSEMRRQMREKDQQIQELRDQFSTIAKRAPTPEEQDEFANMADDDLLTVSQATKLATKMAHKVASDVLKKRDASTAEERAALKFPDYGDVVTRENLETLKRERPRLFNTLAAYSDDPYEQALAAYELIKETGRVSQPESFEKKKAKENSSKPLSVQAMSGSGPVADVNQFANMDPASKKDFLRKVYQDMQSAIKAS